MTLTAAPCAALFCSLLLLVQGCGPLGVHASTLPDLLFRSAGRVSSVEPIDLAGNAAAVEAVARARSYRGELIVLAATASHWPYAINAVSELALLGMEHYVFIAPSRTDCDVLRARRPGLACVFSTLVSNTTMAQEKSFTVWTTRKRYVGRWAALGLGVLQADLDVIWYANPYPALKGALRNVSLVHLQEGKCNEGRANGGMLYAQSACDGSTAHWVLREVYERVRRNEDDPRILETHYPGLFSDEPVKAPAPFPEQKYREIVRRCSDEQDTLRDALLSAFTGQDLHYYNVRSYAWQHTGKEQWFERFAAAKGEDFHCDRVEFGAESLPGVCYVPSKPGKAPRALVRELTPHTRARINRDASEAEVFCDGERPLELGGFAPYELFGGVGLAMNQHTRDRDCSQLSVTTVPGQLWARAPVSPTSIVHLVGVSHPGRGVMQRVAGAWEASIDPQLTEADHVPPARRRGRALALAWPLDVQRFESLDEFEELLQSLLMAADATERVMAVPATLCKLAHTNSRGKWWTGWNSFYQLPIGPGQAATSTALAQPPHVEAPIDRACIWLMQKQEYCKEWEMLHPPDLDKMVAAQGGPTSVKKVPLEQLLATVEGGGSSWEALTWSPHASAPQLPDADFAFDAAKLDALVGGEEAVVVIDIGERHKLPWGVTNIAPGSAVDARIKDRDVRKCIIVKDHQPTGRFSASADRAAEAATRTETHDAAGTHLSKPPSPSPPPSLPSLPLEEDGRAALADVVEEQPAASSGVEQAVRAAATACAKDNAVALVSCDASKKSDIDDTSQPGPCLRQAAAMRAAGLGTVVLAAVEDAACSEDGCCVFVSHAALALARWMGAKTALENGIDVLITDAAEAEPPLLTPNQLPALRTPAGGEYSALDGVAMLSLLRDDADDADGPVSLKRLFLRAGEPGAALAAAVVERLRFFASAAGDRAEFALIEAGIAGNCATLAVAGDSSFAGEQAVLNDVLESLSLGVAVYTRSRRTCDFDGRRTDGAETFDASTHCLSLLSLVPDDGSVKARSTAPRACQVSAGRWMLPEPSPPPPPPPPFDAALAP